MIYLNLLGITLIVVLVHFGGFFETIEEKIGKWLKIRDLHIKLLECEFCQNWWLGLIYIICTNNFSILNVVYILLLSFLTPTLADLIYKIRVLLDKIIEKI